MSHSVPCVRCQVPIDYDTGDIVTCEFVNGKLCPVHEMCHYLLMFFPTGVRTAAEHEALQGDV